MPFVVSAVYRSGHAPGKQSFPDPFRTLKNISMRNTTSSERTAEHPLCFLLTEKLRETEKRIACQYPSS